MYSSLQEVSRVVESYWQGDLPSDVTQAIEQTDIPTEDEAMEWLVVTKELNDLSEEDCHILPAGLYHSTLLRTAFPGVMASSTPYIWSRESWVQFGDLAAAIEFAQLHEVVPMLPCTSDGFRRLLRTEWVIVCNYPNPSTTEDVTDLQGITRRQVRKGQDIIWTHLLDPAISEDRRSQQMSAMYAGVVLLDGSVTVYAPQTGEAEIARQVEIGRHDRDATATIMWNGCADALSIQIRDLLAARRAAVQTTVDEAVDALSVTALTDAADTNRIMNATREPLVTAPTDAADTNRIMDATREPLVESLVAPRNTDDANANDCCAPKLAFCFTGQGSQWDTMAQSLWLEDDTFSSTVKDACAHLPIDVAALFTEGDKWMSKEWSTLGINLVQLGLTAMLQKSGLEPDFIFGHSVGEVACGFADSCMSARECATLSYAM